jgi:predicted CoA-binding protein
MGTYPDVTDLDAIVADVLRRFRTITVVGASRHEDKPAHYVPATMQQHGWRIIPVNPIATTILGERVYPSLADVVEPVEFVNVFRPSARAADVARQAVAVGASALWLQLGIASAEARNIAEDVGLAYVENRCLLIERQRLRLSAPAPLP